MPTSKPSALASLKESLDNRVRIPLFFLGVGLYRAWIEVVYTNPPAVVGDAAMLRGNVSDLAYAAFLLAIALLSQRISPLHQKRGLVWGGCGAMVVATCLNFAPALWPSLAAPLAWPVTLLASWGLAVITLLWCEFYGSLSPFRVILYFSASLVLGWAVVWLLQGLDLAHLLVVSALLPLASTVCGLRSFASLAHGVQDVPSPAAARVPWKLILIMATYTFAFALFQGTPSQAGGPLSSVGMLVAAIAVCVIANFYTDRFSIERLFQTSLPIMALGLFLASFFTQQIHLVSGMFIAASYTLFTVMLMVVLSNLCYSYGANALWLFGIERAVRYVVYALGSNLGELVLPLVPPHISVSTLLGFVAIALIAVSTTLLFMGKGLFASWGVTLKKERYDEAGSQPNPHAQPAQQPELAYGFTPREAEVYHLLAQGKNVAAIEQELFIANGTAKAHIQHIYKKMQVHSRQEFLEMTGQATDASPGNLPADR